LSSARSGHGVQPGQTPHDAPDRPRYRRPPQQRTSPPIEGARAFCPTRPSSTPFSPHRRSEHTSRKAANSNSQQLGHTRPLLFRTPWTTRRTLNPHSPPATPRFSSIRLQCGRAPCRRRRLAARPHRTLQIQAGCRSWRLAVMSKALSLDLRERVLSAMAGGLSGRQAALRFGVSPASVSRWRSLERRQKWAVR